jgi:hypothetical protein
MGRSQGRITSAGLTLCSKEFRWSDPTTALLTKRTQGHECVVASPSLGAPIVAPSIHGTFHQRSIDATFAIQKMVKFVLGLPRLFSFEPDLIGPAKKLWPIFHSLGPPLRRRL